MITRERDEKETLIVGKTITSTKSENSHSKNMTSDE